MASRTPANRDPQSTATASEKQEIEAAIVAARVELGIRYDGLITTLKSLVNELRANLDSLPRKLECEGLAIARDTIRYKTEDLVWQNTSTISFPLFSTMIIWIVNSLSELQIKKRHGEWDAAIEIETEMHGLAVRMRRNRGDLAIMIYWSAAQAHDYLKSLRGRAELGEGDLKHALNNHLKRMEDRHAALQSDLRRLESGDRRALARSCRYLPPVMEGSPQGTLAV